VFFQGKSEPPTTRVKDFFGVMVESQTASHASWLKTQQRFRIFRKTCRAGSLVASTLPKMMKKTHSWLPFSVQNDKAKKKADWEKTFFPKTDHS
jgi:hypothetical protein